MLKLLQAMVSTAGASLLSQILGMLTNKILAVVMGPAGVGIYGMYRQLIDTVAAVVSIGSTGGLVQGLSSTEGEARLRRLKAALVLNAAAILLSSGALAVLAPIIAEKYFVRPELKMVSAVVWLVVPLGLIQIAMTMWNFISISHSFRWLAFVMVVPAIASLAVAWPFAQLAAEDNQWGYLGLLIAPPALQIVFALPIIRRLGWLREVRLSLGVKPTKVDYRHYFSMHGSGLVVYVTSFAAFMVLPPLILRNYGADENGFFRVAYTLGIQNLSILLTSVSSYVYPVMSGARSEEERLRLFQDAALILFMMAIPMIGGLILFQPLIIVILFDRAFLPAIDMLQWMLLGNYFKVVWWIFINVSTTRAHMKLFMLTDSALWLGMLLIGLLAVGYKPGTAPIPWLSGIEGLGIAYFATYIVTTIVTCWVTWWRYRTFTQWRVTILWLIGLVLIGICAAATWRSRTVDWPVSLTLSVMVSVAPLVMLDARRRQQVGELWRRFRKRGAAADAGPG
jgi:O-antigen/teichoic acid export membrane protein